jgi:long-chain fatty acid transport protein
VKKTVIALRVASAIALISASTHAGAAAFALYEHGASGLGNAYAGAAAVAEDATTVWWNPAGMARLPKGRHAAIAGSVISPSTKFSNNGSTPALGSNPAFTGSGGDAGDTAVVPSAFFAMDFDPRWSFGLGVSVPFGLKTEYDRTWIGRFQGIESEVKTININPAVSYKLSDTASVGIGISYQYGEIDLLTGVNLAAVSPGLEGTNRVKLDGDAWGFNAGVLFNVTSATRAGIHYRSSLKYELDGNTTFSGVPAAVAAADPRVRDGNVELDIKTPDSLAFSLAHRMSDRLELLGDLTWWHWSRIDRLPVIRTDGPIAGQPLNTLTFNFDDTWRVSVGANYRLSAPWLLKVGFAYDQTPVPNAESRTVRLPDSDRYWFSAGAKYQLTRSGALDFGYTYVHARDARINNVQNTPPTAANGNIVGTYEANVHVLGIQYQHSF